MPSDGASPPMVELRSKFENTKEEEQQLELSTSPESYMMSGASPIATRLEQQSQYQEQEQLR